MVSVGGAAPFTAVPLRALAPEHQIPCSNSKALACRATTSEDVQYDRSHSQNIPRMQPFNQPRISRFMREPSLLEKAEHAIAERCTALEGNEAYRCWEALFAFESIKEAYRKECDAATVDDRASACRHLERFQNLVRQSGGVSGLIDNILMLAKTSKLDELQVEETPETDSRPVFPEDGGLPLDPGADEAGLLPESSLTRLLRHNGRSPAWFTHRPDHESD